MKTLNTHMQDHKTLAIAGIAGGAIGASLTFGILLMLLILAPADTERALRLIVPPGTARTPVIDREPTLGSSTVVETVKRANPAVVSIVISKDVPVLERSYEEPFDPFSFPFFFETPPSYRENGTQRQEIGGGSGFLVSSDGYIITNRHVVQVDQAEYTVFTNDGKSHASKVVARDPLLDIAVLKIEGTDYPYLEFGDSDKVEIGSTVIAIGNALGEFRNTVSVGVVSGLSRSITADDTSTGQTERLEGVIQTDAAINPGNSGGPLVDLNGRVIAVNVAVASGENIGFALPSNLVKFVVTSVREKGRIVRPFLGIRYVPVTPELKEQNTLTVDVGVLVSRGEGPNEPAVLPGSAADKAGIAENDILLELDGQRIDENHTLSSLIRNKQAGETITIKLLRKGEERTVQATLQEIPQ